MSQRWVRREMALPPPPPSKCAKFLYYTWKLCSVVFSHLVMISLVVAYCILGAVTFERLEADNEKEVKRNISRFRKNTTQSIWSMTRAVPLLNQTHWTAEVVHMLKDFENSLLMEMKARGWDGDEALDSIQWTFTGALFYSIIVITTIGYGHITPKTQSGKVVTIFYAIVGIPLMLLCLSNIGDVMASSFRFLYWRACCYVCTRPPKKKKRPHASVRRSVRGRPGSTRRRKPLERAHSDTDFRYRDSGYSSGRGPRLRPPTAIADRSPRTRSQPPSHSYGGKDCERDDRSPAHRTRVRGGDDYDEENENFPKISLPLQDLATALRDLENHQTKYKPDPRSKSLPRPAKTTSEHESRREWDHFESNRDMYEMHDLHDVDYENFKERKAIEERERRRQVRPVDDSDWYQERGYDPEDDDFEHEPQRYRRTWDDRRKDRGRSEYVDRAESMEGRHGRRARSAVYDYSHRWEDQPRADFETGRGRRLRRLQTVEDSRPPYNDRYSPAQDEWSDEEAAIPRRARPQRWTGRQLEEYPDVGESTIRDEQLKPVPIWLCVLLVASYIVAGTFLFKQWEGWAYLDAAYFCIITLTTIGFGDFVPAQGEGIGARDAAVHSIALCSLYLLIGIALLAMSFNLVQEEVRANVTALAKRLGIIKPQHSAEPDDEYIETEPEY